jgi:PAS domain S-box-containing protein
MEAKNNLQILKKITEELTDKDYLLKRKVAIYEKIIQTLVKGIWIIDSNEKTIYADELVTKMLKCSLEDMQDKSVYEFISDMDKKITRKYINDGINKIKEVKLITKDGKTIKTKITNMVSDEELKEEGIKFLLVNQK